MAKLVDLRQNRSLIKSNFDGYKLSFDTIPTIRQDFEVAPLQAKANEEQYSCLHVELFSLQNLLVADPWHRVSSYFINQNGQVMRCSYDESVGRPTSMEVVWSVPNAADRKPGDYNITCQFVSEKFAVVCDGMTQVYLVDTGDRYKAQQEWTSLFQTVISLGTRNFVIKDALLDVVEGRRVISVLFQRVLNENSAHFTQLFWSVLNFDADTNSWSYEVKEVLQEKGTLYYASFEPKANALVLSSNRQFQFASKRKSEADASAGSAAAPIENVFPFVWTQSNEEIVIKFNAVEGKSKNDYKVNCASNKVSVTCGEFVLLDRELFAKIDTDLTTWSMENDQFQVTLNKCDTLPWPILFLNGPLEDGRPDCMDNQPIANLDAPIEDCDFPLGMSDEDIIIERLDLLEQDVTHKIHLGSNPPLFSTCLRPGFPAALVTRQDVDACVWLQQYQSTEWGLRHEGNLHAFAYVQASKQQRKFIDCSPDLRLAVVCESHRHVFIYESNYDTAEGLRNRNGPQVSIGKQRLVALDHGEVLGMTIDNNVITLLTEKCILFLQINC